MQNFIDKLVLQPAPYVYVNTTITAQSMHQNKN